MPTVCGAGGTPEHPKPCARQAGRLPHKGQDIQERIVVRAGRLPHKGQGIRERIVVRAGRPHLEFGAFEYVHYVIYCQTDVLVIHSLSRN